VTTLRAAVVQLRTPATLAAALDHVAPLVRQAAEQGAELIVTPEATNIIEKDRAKLFARITTLERDPVVQGLAALAAELKVRVLTRSTCSTSTCPTATATGNRRCMRRASGR
jgi:predicted amidohydrolase